MRNLDLDNFVIQVKQKYNRYRDAISVGDKTPHSISIGIPGSGKTSRNKREAELRFLNVNHKLFGIYDAGRMDLAYFMFPSTSDYWKRPKYENNKIYWKRKFPVTLLYPMSKNLPSKIPNNAKVFTIPVNSLDKTDISALTGLDPNDMSISMIFEYMQDYVKKDTDPIDYLNIMANSLKRVEDSDEIKPSHHGVKKMKYGVIKTLTNEYLLSSEDYEHSLNIVEEIKNKKTITVLVLKYFPRVLWGFLVAYFLNHLYQHLTGFGVKKRINQKTTVILNELANLLQETVEEGTSAKAVSKLIDNILRESRSANMFLLTDTQIPQQLPTVKNIVSNINVFNCSFDELDVALRMLGASKKLGIIPDDLYQIIGQLSEGEYIRLSKRSKAIFVKSVWTQSRTFEEGDEFEKIYDEVYGKEKYQDIKKIKDDIKSLHKKSSDVWKYKNLYDRKRKKSKSQDIQFSDKGDSPMEDKTKKSELEEHDAVIERVKKMQLASKVQSK